MLARTQDSSAFLLSIFDYLRLDSHCATLFLYVSKKLGVFRKATRKPPHTHKKNETWKPPHGTRRAPIAPILMYNFVICNNHVESQHLHYLHCHLLSLYIQLPLFDPMGARAHTPSCPQFVFVNSIADGWRNVPHGNSGSSARPEKIEKRLIDSEKCVLSGSTLVGAIIEV